MATGRTPAPKSAFSFPELKVTDIVASLLELGVTGLKDKDLMEPKSEVVQKVYEHLVHGLMFKTKEEMSQPNFEGLQEIVYMDLHDESIPRINFYRSCRNLLLQCEAPDFSLTDWMKPESARLRRALSGVINFAKYWEDKVAQLNDLTAHSEELDRTRQDLMATKSSLEKEVVEETARRESEMPAIRKAEAVEAQLKEVIAEKNKQQAIMRHEASEIKAETGRLKAEIVTREATLAELREACDKQAALIVQSPERMKQELQQLTLQLREEEEAAAEVEAHRKEMRSRLEGVEKLARTVEALRGSLTEAKEGLTTCKAAAKERKALQDKIERHRDECTSLDSAKKTLERSLQRTSEKLAEFRPVAEAKSGAARKALAAARLELERVSKENRELSEAREVALDSRNAILKKRDEARRQHQALVEEMNTSYSRLMGRVREYHASLRAAMA